MGQVLYMITLDTKKIQENLAPFIGEEFEKCLDSIIRVDKCEVSKEVLINKIKTDPNSFTAPEVSYLYSTMEILHCKLYSDYQKEIREIRKTGSIRADVLKMNILKFLKHYGVNLLLELNGRKLFYSFLEMLHDYNNYTDRKITFYNDDSDWSNTCLAKDLHHFSSFFLSYFGQACISLGSNEEYKTIAIQVLNDIKLIDPKFYSIGIKIFEEDKKAMDEDDVNWVNQALFHDVLSLEKEIVKLPIDSIIWNFKSD